MNVPAQKTRKVSRPAAALLLVVLGINVIGMVHAFLSVVVPEGFSTGGADGVGTSVLAIAGAIAILASATRRRRT